MKVIITLEGDYDQFCDTLKGIAEEIKAETNLSGGDHGDVRYAIEYEVDQ